MTKQTFKNVEPIRPGYAWAVEIGFAEDFWTAHLLATGRLVAQFRHTLDSAVLFTADTEDASMTRPGGRVLAISIPPDKTALLSAVVVFDFVRVDGTAQMPVPGRWQWPVVRTVTRDVA